MDIFTSYITRNTQVTLQPNRKVKQIEKIKKLKNKADQQQATNNNQLTNFEEVDILFGEDDHHLDFYI